MEAVLESILGQHTLSASQARKLHHLSHTPPEYWTPKQRILSGKARTRWLHEENKRAKRGGSPMILDRIWPVGPYWPNSGALAGGEAARREFRAGVGKMRYLDQARAEAHARHFHVHPSTVLGLPRSALVAEGDWTHLEPNQILNDRCRTHTLNSAHPTRHIGRANLHFSPRELLRDGRFGAMVGAETEEERYARGGWERLEGPFYGPAGTGNWDGEGRPRVFEGVNGIGGEDGRRGLPCWR